jgi:hypothetical protein
MHANIIPVAALALMLWPEGARGGCDQDLDALDAAPARGDVTETFEARGGMDNQFHAITDPGNFLDPDFRIPDRAPPLWGEESGLVFVGATNGGTFWIQRDTIDSPTGYHFTASFLIVVDGISEGKRTSLFISKPQAEAKGNSAAWRLTAIKVSGQFQLELLLGANSAENNPSAIRYVIPIATNRTYDVAITYDTRRRFYLWSVDGQVIASGDMPCDFPLIGTKVIGSSASGNGRNTVFIVDNVRWYELP